MRYYIVSLHDKEIHIPQIINWYKDVPVQSFFRGKIWEIPARNLLFVKDCGWEPCYRKLLFSPFPLIHKSVLPVFQAYGLRDRDMQMVFLDTKYKTAELYHLLTLPCMMGKVKREGGKAGITCEHRTIADRDAFYVMENQKCRLVCSLGLLESLIREGVTGITIEELTVQGEA